MYFCFIGMILGSVPAVYNHAKDDKMKPRNIAVFICALIFTIALAFASDGAQTNKTLEQLGGISPSLIAWIVFASFISTIVMVLPGISGSVAMLLLGTYTVSIEAVSTFNIVILSAIGVGVLLGGLTGVKFVKIMLKAHPRALYSAVLGLIIGSAFMIYNMVGFSPDINGILSIIFMLMFAALTYLFSKKQPAI